MITVALDPGLRDLGCAVFRDQTLIAATLVRVPGKERGPAQWVRVSKETWSWVLHTLTDLPDPRYANAFVTKQHLTVSEYPQSYIASQQKGDQADILELAGVVGATCAELGGSVTGLLPREWKGQLPKPVMTARIQKRLSAPELALMRSLDVPPSLMHNVWDSVGIGLFHLGRLSPTRIP